MTTTAIIILIIATNTDYCDHEPHYLQRLISSAYCDYGYDQTYQHCSAYNYLAAVAAITTFYVCYDRYDYYRRYQHYHYGHYGLDF